MLKRGMLIVFLFAVIFIIGCEDIKGINIRIQSDFNNDGCVGFEDFVGFSSAYGSKQGDVIYDNNPVENSLSFKKNVNSKIISKFDFNSDGEINFPDFVTFSQNYGKGCDEVQPELDTGQLGQQAATKTTVDCDAYSLEEQRNECWIIKAGLGDASLCENIIDSESEQNQENLKCICNKKVLIGLGENADFECTRLISDVDVPTTVQVQEYEYVTDCSEVGAKKVADLYCGGIGAHSYEVGKTNKVTIYLPSERLLDLGVERDYMKSITCYVANPGGFSYSNTQTVQEPVFYEDNNEFMPRRISPCYEEARLK